MRITTNMMHDALLGNVNNNSQNYHKIQNQISTQKRYQTASEDTIGSAIANNHRISERAFDRYLENLDIAEGYLKATENNMASLNDVIVNAMEIAEYNSTETANDESREIAIEQINQLIEQSFDIANGKFRDRYLFSGYNTDEQAYGNEMKILPPYTNIDNQYDQTIQISGEYNSNTEKEYLFKITEAGNLGDAKYQISEDGGDTWSDEATIYSQVDLFDSTNSTESGLDITFQAGDFAAGDTFKVNVVRGKYSGDDGVIKNNTGISTQITTNVNGQDLFEDNEYFDTLYKLKFALKNNSVNEISESLEKLNEIQANVQNQTAQVGSKINIVEMNRNNLESQRMNLTEAISDIEDTDMVSAISELSMQEVSLQASISVLSKVMKTSLLNYI
ncbi:MAG: flagellar hook-associated protein FlgL [Candidatus Cloacimonadota bacterium]|nr:flagellar hook-associated protein FlgL [Candidatus Cloacimonadota bacterium]